MNTENADKINGSNRRSAVKSKGKRSLENSPTPKNTSRKLRMEQNATRRSARQLAATEAAVKDYFQAFAEKRRLNGSLFSIWKSPWAYVFMPDSAFTFQKELMQKTQTEYESKKHNNYLYKVKASSLSTRLPASMDVSIKMAFKKIILVDQGLSNGMSAPKLRNGAKQQVQRGAIHSNELQDIVKDFVDNDKAMDLANASEFTITLKTAAGTKTYGFADRRTHAAVLGEDPAGLKIREILRNISILYNGSSLSKKWTVVSDGDSYVFQFSANLEQPLCMDSECDDAFTLSQFMNFKVTAYLFLSCLFGEYCGATSSMYDVITNTKGKNKLVSASASVRRVTNSIATKKMRVEQEEYYKAVKEKGQTAMVQTLRTYRDKVKSSSPKDKLPLAGVNERGMYKLSGKVIKDLLKFSADHNVNGKRKIKLVNSIIDMKEGANGKATDTQFVEVEKASRLQNDKYYSVNINMDAMEEVFQNTVCKKYMKVWPNKEITEKEKAAITNVCTGLALRTDEEMRSLHSFLSKIKNDRNAINSLTAKLTALKI
jgi:hypothetical protein